ncbi:hypothetical protein BDW74DRAFT_146774 [Aspergillus multicolor]|uniref:bZIP transcription factor n=1 Tax=Aspergillus multicolor TaxID=41759 RepID=UPI003CCCC279
METEFYNTINWALTTDPTDALFPWDVSPRSAAPEASRWGDLDPQLGQLLSASSYPLPEPQGPLQTQAEAYNNQVPLFGGLVLDNDNLSSTDSSVQSTEFPATTAYRPPQRTSRTTATEPTRKRGRPRKLIDDAGVNPEERRRTQVRMAQRAYRSRKEASVSSLKDRINQLETAMKQISTAVISFGDDLVRSGALDTHPDLLKPLGNTVQACLALPVIPNSTMDTNYQLDLPGRNKGLLASSPDSAHISEGETPMSIPTFIDRLHVTCSYQAYLVTANSSIPQRRIERPFRILLSLMPRTFVAEFFKDWLLARAGHKTMAHWEHIPFFRLGGAGTHYPSPANVHHPFPAHRSGSSSPNAHVQEDVAAFTSDMSDEEIEDVWFDLGDLQGYLVECGVVLPEYSVEVSMVGLGVGVKEKDKGSGATRVSRLMQSLVRCAICLGRSPGFRRRDVEAAVDAFMAAQDASASRVA